MCFNECKNLPQLMALYMLVLMMKHNLVQLLFWYNFLVVCPDKDDVSCSLPNANLYARFDVIFSRALYIIPHRDFPTPSSNVCVNDHTKNKWKHYQTLSIKKQIPKHGLLQYKKNKRIYKISQPVFQTLIESFSFFFFICSWLINIIICLMSILDI